MEARVTYLGMRPLIFLLKRNLAFRYSAFATQNETSRNRLGRLVGIVLVSGLQGREAEEFPRIAETV